MKRTILSILSIIILAVIMVMVALKVPLPLATNSDFKVIYYTTQGLTLGIDVYDHPAKIGMINEVYNTNVDANFMPQFAYPPWYALSTFYLGYLPIQQAAVLWFEINLAMLFLSLYFLTDGWKPLYRLLAFPAALFFFPVLGTLAIGQYDFPVLLGASMLIHAFKHKNAALTAPGMALLTFKPHLGGLILIAGLIYLWVSHTEGRFLPRSISDKMDRYPSVAHASTSVAPPLSAMLHKYGTKSITYTIYTGIFLFLVGFLADSSWLVNYLGSLFSYRDLGHITTCSECVNISVWLSRRISGELSLSQAGAIAGVILTALLVILYLNRKALLQSPSLLIASVLLVTLLASPYLYNYDFILLLVPFALLVETKTEKIVTLFCFLVPTVALVTYGRDANIILVVVTIVISFPLYLRIKRAGIDVPSPASYNVNN